MAQGVVGERHRYALSILLRGNSAGGRMIDGFRLVIQRIDRFGLAPQQVVFEVGGIAEWIDLLQQISSCVVLIAGQFGQLIQRGDGSYANRKDRYANRYRICVNSK